MTLTMFGTVAATRTWRIVRERGAGGPGYPGPDEIGRPGRRRPSGPPSMSVRFSLGRLVATPGALEVMERASANPAEYLARHATCDWGEVDADDWAANDRALVDGTRLLSAYRLPDGATLWVITEDDRSATTFLLPSEY